MNEIRPISKEELLLMIKKYNIGKKPLATLLGWGETTVLLYAAQDEIPDNGYTQTLYRLYKNPTEYLEVLLKNKAKLTPVAFRKSFTAVTSLENKSKVTLISQFIVDSIGHDISLARLSNILMWSQILSLVFNGNPVFNDVYQPIKGNFPYKQIAEQYNNGEFIMVKNNQEVKKIIDDSCFDLVKSTRISEAERDLVNYVINVFEWYGESAMNHLLAAERFRICGPVKNRKKNASHESLRKIYKEVFEQSKVKKIKDVSGFMAKRLEALRKTAENI